MSKVACVSGISGQTGSYISEILLDKGYKVYGLKRSASNPNTQRIDHLYQDSHINNKLELVYGYLADTSSINSFISDIKPDLFFNCGAVSNVRTSFDIPEYTMDITGAGPLRCLEAIRKYSPKTRFLQCSTSELYGATPPPPEGQGETTPFHPRSPYAVAKLAAYWSVINYRESYKLFACNAISHNHESPRRGFNFVTKKITSGLVRCSMGLQEHLYLGHLEARRDFSHAKDIAEGLHLIINSDTPEEYVLSSDKSTSVKEFLDLVAEKLNIDWKQYVRFDARYLRPAEVPDLRGNSLKARTKLGWTPKYDLKMLIDEMIEYDLTEARKEKLIKEAK
jgi:GDPmannose 4,6-dehydratase